MPSGSMVPFAAPKGGTKRGVSVHTLTGELGRLQRDIQPPVQSADGQPSHGLFKTFVEGILPGSHK